MAAWERVGQFLLSLRGVHLHVVQPRETYTADNTFGLYFTLEGHGDALHPQPLDNRQISLSIYNVTFLVAREMAHHRLERSSLS